MKEEGKRVLGAHIRKHKIFYQAVGINLVFLLLAILFCDMKYEVSDDFVMDTILSGGYSREYDSHLLYSNILLGYALKIIYQIFPVISWYFVMHIALCFLALTTVSFVLLQQAPGKMGFFLSLLMVSFFSDDLYLLVQFTKTAAVCAMAGGLLFLYAYWHGELFGRIKACYMAWGAALCLLGTMVRQGVVKMVLPFLFLIFLKEVFSYVQKKRRVPETAFWDSKQQRNAFFLKTGLGILLCGMLVVAAQGLNRLNTYLWSHSPGYETFLADNARRSSVVDVNIGGWEVMEEAYTQAGFSAEDFYTVKSWNIVDQDIYTPEAMKALSGLGKADSQTYSHNPVNIIASLKQRRYYRYTTVWAMVLLVFVIALWRPKRLWWALFDLLLTVGLLVYLIYSGRIVYRVEYGLFFCAAVNLAMDGIAGGMPKTERAGRFLRLLVPGMLLLCVAKIPLYIPDTRYQTLSDEEYRQYVYDVFYESWNFHMSKYRAVVSKREPYGELIDLMESDTEHYYLCDFNSTIQLLYYNYKPWIRVPIGYYVDHYSYLGGVTTYFPGCYYAWSQNGLDYRNPYRTITQPNIRIVDNDFYLTKLDYYRKYYNAGAVEEPVGEWSGFRVWHLRDAAGSQP